MLLMMQHPGEFHGRTCRSAIINSSAPIDAIMRRFCIALFPVDAYLCLRRPLQIVPSDAYKRSSHWRSVFVKPVLIG